MAKLVTVIIPNFNRQHLIGKAIESVLNQTYQNFELIIVDDNSTDKSKEVILKYQQMDNRIKTIFLDDNRGANYCRNIGAKEAQGNYLAFLDSDDEFEDEKLKLQIETFETNTRSIGIIFTNYSMESIKVNNISEDYVVKITEILPRNKLGGFSTIMIPKKIFVEVGGLDDRLKSCQDWDLYLKILDKYDGFYLSRSLVNYFLQNDSISKNKEKVIEGHRAIFKKIDTLNASNQYVDQRTLESEHLYLIGDIYRRFEDYGEARKYYVLSLKKKLTLKGVQKLLGISLGKKTYHVINTLRK